MKTINKYIFLYNNATLLADSKTINNIMNVTCIMHSTVKFITISISNSTFVY